MLQSCARLTDLAASASAAADTGWDLQQHARRGGGGRCPGPAWGSWTLELHCRWSLQLCPSLLGWASCPSLVTVPQAVFGTCPHQPCCAAGTPSSWLSLLPSARRGPEGVTACKFNNSVLGSSARLLCSSCASSYPLLVPAPELLGCWCLGCAVTNRSCSAWESAPRQRRG